MARSLGFYGDGISFQVVFSQSFWLRVLGGARLVQPRWMPKRRILGGGQTWGVSFWPFLNSSGGCWLISSMFLTSTSCCKTTHTSGYYDAWPRWAISVSVLPPQNNILLRKLTSCLWSQGAAHRFSVPGILLNILFTLWTLIFIINQRNMSLGTILIQSC